MLLIFTFHKCQRIMLSVSSEQFLVFQTFFLFLQLELSITVMKSYMLIMFSFLFQAIFHLLDDKFQWQFVVFSCIDGISWFHQFLDAQMLFKDATLNSHGCFWFMTLILKPSAPRLVGIFSVGNSAGVFCLLTFPFQPGHTSGCWHHYLILGGKGN